MNRQTFFGPPAAELTIHNPLSTMQPGEQIVCEIKRHPIGIIGIYITVGLLLVVVAVVGFIVIPSFLSSYGRGQLMIIGGLIFLLSATIASVFLFIANKVYWDNYWVVTSDSVTQIKRSSLFDKQTSQLSLGNLEDISAEQDGVFQHMFHYGIISAETAGATDKFTFIYCPNPTYYAKLVLAAREKFEQERHVAAGALTPSDAPSMSEMPEPTIAPPATAAPEPSQEILSYNIPDGDDTDA